MIVLEVNFSTYIAMSVPVDVRMALEQFALLTLCVCVCVSTV